MTRNITITIVALLLLPWGAATAQRMYKWVDAQGNVSYHDRPPPADAGYRVQERKLSTKQDDESDANQDAATKSPVVLYSVPKCSPCDQARSHLKKRNVPFSEKNVEKDPKLQEELKAKAGALSVPTIMVGAKVLNSYTEGWLDSELDQAGYAKFDPTKSAEKPKEEEGFQAPTQ